MERRVGELSLRSLRTLTTPIATRAKRGAILAALAVLCGAAVVTFAQPNSGQVLAVNTLVATVGDVFGPAVAALITSPLAVSWVEIAPGTVPVMS